MSSVCSIRISKFSPKRIRGSQKESYIEEIQPNSRAKWTFKTGGGVTSSPTVADRTVYVGSYDDHLYAVDANRGTEQWCFETDSIVDSSPAVAGGKVFVGGDDNRLYAIDVDTGTQKWTFQTGGKVMSPTAADGTVYVGAGDYLYALDTKTGSLQWRVGLYRRVLSSPLVVEGTVYAGSQGNRLSAINVEGTASSSGSRVLLGTLNHHDTHLQIDPAEIEIFEADLTDVGNTHEFSENADGQESTEVNGESSVGTSLCPECGAEIPETVAQFCIQCGTDLSCCPGCGSDISDPDAKFCSQCGMQL